MKIKKSNPLTTIRVSRNLKIKLISVGTKMPSWLNEGIAEYSKRLPKDFQLQLIEVPMAKRGKSASVAQYLKNESQGILNHVAKTDFVVAMEVKGKSYTTERLSERFSRLLPQGQDVCLLVGGPDGLGEACRVRADEQWSLSALTLPHPMVRLLLAEQIYRVWSLLQGHPYHRS